MHMPSQVCQKSFRQRLIELADENDALQERYNSAMGEIQRLQALLPSEPESAGLTHSSRELIAPLSAQSKDVSLGKVIHLDALAVPNPQATQCENSRNGLAVAGDLVPAREYPMISASSLTTHADHPPGCVSGLGEPLAVDANSFSKVVPRVSASELPSRTESSVSFFKQGGLASVTASGPPRSVKSSIVSMLSGRHNEVKDILSSDFLPVGKAKSSKGKGRMIDDERERLKLRRATIAWMDWLLGTRQGQWIVLFMYGFLLVVSGACIWKVTGGNDEFETSWRDSFWVAWILFIDPGTQTGFPPSDPDRIKLVAVLLSVCGFVYNLSALGMVVELVKSRLARWHDERYAIVLTGHVLVLSWSGKTLYLLEEVIAKAVAEKRKIVILSEREEIDMKQDIVNHFFRQAHLTSHIVVRQGCPFCVDDLVRVSAGSAQDIIVLDREADSSNLEVVRVIVALAALPKEVTGRVIAEVDSAETAPVIEALLARTDGVHAHGAVTHILANLALCPLTAECLMSLFSAGLGAAEELMVIAAGNSLSGKTFKDIYLRVTCAVCVGVKPVDNGIVLAPSDDFLVDSPGDRLLFLGRDRFALERQIRQVDKMGAVNPTTIDEHFTALPSSDANASWRQSSRSTGLRQMSMRHTYAHSICRKSHHTSKSVARRPIIIIIGWGTDAVTLLKTVNDLAAASGDVEVHILSEFPIESRVASFEGFVPDHIHLVHHVGDRDHVHQLAHLPLKDADVILILADAAAAEEAGVALHFNPTTAPDTAITQDSMNLTIMVTIHGILDGRFGHHKVRGERAKMVIEILDPRTDQLLARNQALQAQAEFFRTFSLESSLFAKAAAEPVTFNALMLLLSLGAGSLATLPVTKYLPSRSSITEHQGDGDVVGDQTGHSFAELYDLVRKNDALLVGWWRYPRVDEEGHERDGVLTLAPLIDRRKKIQWLTGDTLVVIRSTKEQLEEADEDLEEDSGSEPELG